MKAIAARPDGVVRRALELLERGRQCGRREARVLVVGASYKPGVRDTRESPAVRIMRELAEAGRGGRLPRPAGALARGG